MHKIYIKYRELCISVHNFLKKSLFVYFIHFDREREREREREKEGVEEGQREREGGRES